MGHTPHRRAPQTGVWLSQDVYPTGVQLSHGHVIISQRHVIIAQGHVVISQEYNSGRYTDLAGRQLSLSIYLTVTRVSQR